jgi:glycosyltransferase involved in cell wall biosynthesis
MRFSVCVPVFDPTQKYLAQISQLLNSIKSQTMKPDEVVMTANHDLAYLDDLQEMTKGDFKLVFKINESNGSAENTNHAISLSKGEFVKIMHQDDFFVNNNALNLTYRSLHKSKKVWRVSGFDHLVESTSLVSKESKPKITWRLINGVNKIGAPSVSAFKRSAFIPFDEEMKYMFDCDWYLKMLHNWGKPLVSKNVEVRIRIHDGQASNWAVNLLQQEIVLTKQNHNRLHLFMSKCRCAMQKNKKMVW